MADIWPWCGLLVAQVWWTGSDHPSAIIPCCFALWDPELVSAQTDDKVVLYHNMLYRHTVPYCTFFYSVILFQIGLYHTKLYRTISYHIKYFTWGGASAKQNWTHNYQLSRQFYKTTLTLDLVMNMIKVYIRYTYMALFNLRLTIPSQRLPATHFTRYWWRQYCGKTLLCSLGAIWGSVSCPGSLYNT